nr:immunoglobulin heavy chain junction region [Macaca mulatta]
CAKAPPTSGRSIDYW